MKISPKKAGAHKGALTVMVCFFYLKSSAWIDYRVRPSAPFKDTRTSVTVRKLLKLKPKGFFFGPNPSEPYCGYAKVDGALHLLLSFSPEVQFNARPIKTWLFVYWFRFVSSQWVLIAAPVDDIHPAKLEINLIDWYCWFIFPLLVSVNFSIPAVLLTSFRMIFSRPAVRAKKKSRQHHKNENHQIPFCDKRHNLITTSGTEGRLSR